MLHPETPWRISIAHTGGLGMLALSPFRIGVDVERLRALRPEEFAGAAFTRAERRALDAEPDDAARTRLALRCWTRKESVLKAAGIGITVDLTSVETRGWAPGPALVTTEVSGSAATWRVYDAPVPDGWTASVALPAAAHRPPSVRELVRE
ncbi:4'-phosphopantetheinyl transferase family protein [Streptomyces massasporeus]|uniref:4'-phosphopantetheinyl transferase family protein n=1 Tax=Streptomyces massasporeus TaxID=67324 RepID=UPI0037F5B7CE